MSAEPRIALVTGAGTGIGRAASLALAADGWTVAATGRRLPPLEETIALVREAGSAGIAVSGDVGDPGAVAGVFERVLAEFGRLDLLFNNAGLGTPPVPLEDLTYEQWQQVVDTNLTGAFLCTQHAFRIMRDQRPRGGRIINNGSISAHAPRPLSAPYTATKHAITGLTRAASLDGRAYDIAVGQIDIGNAATEMTERMAAGVLQPDGSTRVEPRIEAAEVGRGIAYMAGLPLDANVQFMTVMATKMPFIGRG